MLYLPAVVFLFGSRGPDPGAATAIVVALLLLVVAGLWLVGVATLLTRSTGICLD